MPFYLRNYVIGIGALVFMILLTLLAFEPAQSYVGQSADNIGMFVILIGVVITLAGVATNHTAIGIIGLAFVSTGVAITPFGVIAAAIATLVCVGFLTLAVRDRYPRDVRPTFWFAYVCIAGPFIGAVLVQYLLQTERSMMDALVLSGIGTVIFGLTAHKAQARTELGPTPA